MHVRSRVEWTNAAKPLRFAYDAGVHGALEAVASRGM